MTTSVSPETGGRTDPSHRQDERAARRVLRRLGYAIPVALLIASLLFLFWGGSHWWSRPYGFFKGVGKGPDATTLISTLVVVHTFFVAAYGALTPMVVGAGKDALTSRQVPRGRIYLRSSALVLMTLAVALDLFG